MVRILVNRPVRLSTMAVVTDTGVRISLSSSPTEFDYSNSASVGSIERTGKKKISRTVSPGTAQLTFSHTVAALDWHKSIAPQLSALMELGQKGKTVRFVGGSTLEQANWWTITGMQLSVVQRNPANEPTRARIQWNLIEAVDVVAIAGGIQPTPASENPAQRVIVQAPAPARTYTVVPGDTLWGIAQKFLGNGARWPEIWNMNQDKIANPNLITVGQVLRIPAG